MKVSIVVLTIILRHDDRIEFECIGYTEMEPKHAILYIWNVGKTFFLSLKENCQCKDARERWKRSIVSLWYLYKRKLSFLSPLTLSVRAADFSWKVILLGLWKDRRDHFQMRTRFEGTLEWTHRDHFKTLGVFLCSKRTSYIITRCSFIPRQSSEWAVQSQCSIRET